MTFDKPASDLQAITRPPRHHFFGYYDKCPWDATGRYVLGLEATFIDRPVGADDVAVIGLIDRGAHDAWKPIAETRAWNWQQGCTLQWLPAAPTSLSGGPPRRRRYDVPPSSCRPSRDAGILPATTTSAHPQMRTVRPPTVGI